MSMQVAGDFDDENQRQIASESELIPYHAVRSLGKGPILVLAPHPDDEVFGCAGAIMRHVAAGDSVTVVILTDGGGFQSAGPERDAYVAQRRQESRAAAALLGYGEPVFWEYRDRKLFYDEALVQRICQTVAITSAGWLYAPSPYELHPDHRHLSLAALEVVRRTGSALTLAFYEISTPLPLNRLLDISDLLERKRQAIHCFVSQLSVQAYDRHVEALNCYRTYTLSQDIKAAEGYWVIDGDAVMKDLQGPHVAMIEQWQMIDAATTMRGPLVSVIIRTIGRPELSEALRSVAMQTYPRIEIVVVDARGTGRLELQESRYRYPLRIVSAGVALGRGAAANRGLDAAHGEYLIFLDDDDWFLPEHIAGLINAVLKNDHARVAYGAVECVKRNAEGQWERNYVFNQPFDRIRLLIENYIPIHAALFHRSLVEAGCRVDESLEIYEDWDFWIQLSHRTDFVFVDWVGAIYRIGQSSGFGLAGGMQTVNRGLQALFVKWRRLWSDEQVVSIAHYAKYHSMYEELRCVLDAQSQQVAVTREDWQVAINREQAAITREQVAITREQAAIAREQAAKNHNLIICEKLTAAQQIINEQQTMIEAQSRDVQRLLTQLSSMETSTSWRITAPMRVVVTQCRRLMQAGRVLFYFLRQNVRLAGQIWHAQGTRALLVRVVRKLARLARRRLDEAPLAADWRLEQTVHPLSFPVHAQPRVSIIIPVHNQPLYTFSCLKSLVEHPSAADAEVIVVDDHSDDETAQMLEQITGIRTVRNIGERGFVPACNLGAAQAHGDYLVFLNNDTLVSPGWLDALLAVFARFPDAGLVGARLIYPDGRLQAAGGVIWRDGSAAHLGWGDRANAPEYSYVRKADYCPGACIAIPRTLFDAVGRFSEEFAPAYYEDTDLAFKVRQAGQEVYYQPAAIIRHVEGVSMGQNALTGFKRFQVLHRQRFQEKWRQTLSSHPINNGEPVQARDRGVWKRLLVVDKVMLTPDQDSGSLRMFRLLEELVGLGVKVVFVTLYLDDREPYRSQLQQIGVEVLYPPRESTVRGYLERCGRQFDAVMLSRADVAEMLMDAVRELAPAALRIFDTVDLHYLREERMAELQANASLAKAAAARKQTELSLMQKADVTLVVSPFEQALLAKENPDLRIEVVSNIHDLHGCAAGYAEREGLLFIGGFDHPPNVDAMLYYVNEILPRIQQALGPVKTWIIGSKPPVEIRALASETVIVEGFVEDVSGHFARARLSIAPLRYGAGVKGKINMSMAYGVPVVATPLAVEGMWLTDGMDVLVGADAAAFADAVVRLYRDPRLWEMLSENGMRNLEQYFSRRVARQTMAAILQQAPRS